MDEVRAVTACQQPVAPETSRVVLLSAGALAVLAGAVLWRRRAAA
jgi:MYXO-CTERM domain-containing protein